MVPTMRMELDERIGTEHIAMAYSHGLHSHGLCSYGLYSYGPGAEADGRTGMEYDGARPPVEAVGDAKAWGAGIGRRVARDGAPADDLAGLGAAYADGDSGSDDAGPLLHEAAPAKKPGTSAPFFFKISEHADGGRRGPVPI